MKIISSVINSSNYIPKLLTKKKIGFEIDSKSIEKEFLRKCFFIDEFNKPNIPHLKIDGISTKSIEISIKLKKLKNIDDKIYKNRLIFYEILYAKVKDPNDKIFKKCTFSEFDKKKHKKDDDSKYDSDDDENKSKKEIINSNELENEFENTFKWKSIILNIKENNDLFKKSVYNLKKYKFDGLKLDTNYLIKVRCKTGLHYSDYCNMVFFKTMKIIEDKWDYNYTGNGITINGKVLKKTNCAHRTSLLTKEVPANSKSKHIWKFKIVNYVSSAWNPFIGIYKPYTYGKSLRANPKNTYITATLGAGYAYISYNSKGNKNNPNSSALMDYGQHMYTGDIITMTLNMKKLTLSFKHNKKDYGKSHDVERTTYRAGVSMYNTNNEIEFISYEIE